MIVLTSAFVLLSAFSCGGGGKATGTNEQSEKVVVNVPQFDADSAYLYVKNQVDFGPRVPNTKEHTAVARKHLFVDAGSCHLRIRHNAGSLPDRLDAFCHRMLRKAEIIRIIKIRTCVDTPLYNQFLILWKRSSV